MTQNNNTERLKILQDRLAQIKDKDKRITNLTQEEISNEVIKEKEEPKEKLVKKSSRKKYLVIGLGFLIGFYLIPIDKLLNSDFLTTKINTFTKEKGIDKKVEETNNIPPYDFSSIEYKIEKLNIKNGAICIIENKNIEADAIEKINNLKEKGFKANYFFQPEYSDNSEEMYTIFIGPYENTEELKQWQKNLEEKLYRIIKI